MINTTLWRNDSGELFPFDIVRIPIECGFDSGDRTFERVTEYKDLCVLIDRKLTFAKHIEMVKSKATAACVSYLILNKKLLDVLWLFLIMDSYGMLSINSDSIEIIDKSLKRS